MNFRAICSFIAFQICLNFLPSLKQNIRNRSKYLAFFVLIWVISTEFFVYAIWPVFWPSFKKNSSSETVKILVVGDPQLLGYQNTMTGLFGYLARWDSDRFLEKTHRLADNYFQPEMTIFLGDNFDEGEIANDKEFQHYFQRFLDVFQRVNFSKAIILAGDNDIGGEHSYPTRTYRERFNSYFKADGFLQHKYVEFFKFNGMTRKPMYEKVFTKSKNVRVLLSHIPLLPTMSPDAKRVLEELQPQLIISAHEHISVYMSVDDRNFELRDLRQDFTENFRLHYLNTTDGCVHEILVPATSYRMGSPKIGYGALAIESDGSVYYTVLWLPPRLKLLYGYALLIALVAFIVCPGISNLLLKLLPRNILFNKQR